MRKNLKIQKFFTHCCIYFCMLASILVQPTWLGKAQESNPLSTAQQQAEALLEKLSAEERVGQLFLITFKGNDVNPESEIMNLINTYHIGGVVLQAKNDNFILIENKSKEEIVSEVLKLTSTLQENVWESSLQNQDDPITNTINRPNYIPPFIAISQEGNGYPYDQILYGMTPLPNAMAIGASWTPELAAQIGDILGKELEILGINMLLGPSLDVLEPSHQDVSNSLGTRAFGGDPYWVAEMGRAYIKGVHEGGQGKVAVVAKHFPGHGSSDRLPEEEVSTVRKSLEELNNFDLAPFFAVTGNAETEEETVDALLVSNIRYQGLQGNIRATTRPVSFDPQAFSLLMNLPELESWRSQGGVMISDDLGSQAVRGFYDLSGQGFDPRRVTLNAFLAGNDLLYVGDYSTNYPLEEGELANGIAETVQTLDLFTQKYREDAAFAQRVDNSVFRILTLKYQLYPSFSLDQIQGSEYELQYLGESNEITFEVARQSATLISPSQEDLDESIPDAPSATDNIVFITDQREIQQCSQCPSLPIVETDAVENSVLKLYGAQAGGQVSTYHLASHSLRDLDNMLTADPLTTQIESDLRRANWIIFVMLNARSDLPSFQTLQQFLSDRPDLVQQKRLMVFALCAPYFLDATTISKLSAYYALYSQTPPFIDVIAYLLFKELRPNGASPVSIPGIGYDLNEALFPDPDQVISLKFDLPEPEIIEGTAGTPEPTPLPEYRIGEIIPLRTGVILDHNGNPVPNGTPVNFFFTSSADASSLTQVENTIDGIAKTTFSIIHSGALEIRAESENARSNVIKLDIPATENGIETAPPTLEPSETPTSEPTATMPPMLITETPTPSPAANTGFADWVLAFIITGAISLISFRLAALIGKPRWGVRAGLLAYMGGLLAYTYLALELPGTSKLLEISVPLSVFSVTFVGAVMGMLAFLTWQIIASDNHRKRVSNKKLKR